MAKTAAEYQREYRKRKAEAAKLAGDPTDKITKHPFNEHLVQHGDWITVAETLASVGIAPPSFDNDVDEQWQEEWGEPYRASIGRAERMVEAFITGAAELSSIINRYKQKEINGRIHEIETGDLSDPETRKQALADIVRLKKMLDQLDKQVRWTFPQWKVAGE